MLPYPINSGIISGLDNIVVDFASIEKIKLSEEDVKFSNVKRPDDINENEISMHSKRQKISDAINDNTISIPCLDNNTNVSNQNDFSGAQNLIKYLENMVLWNTLMQLTLLIKELIYSKSVSMQTILLISEVNYDCMHRLLCMK